MSAPFYIEAPVTGNGYGEPDGYTTLRTAMNHAEVFAFECEIDLDVTQDGQAVARVYADGTSEVEA